MREKNKGYRRVRLAVFLLGLFFGAGFAMILYFSAAELIGDLQPILSSQEIAVPETNAWNLVTAVHSRYWHTVFPAILFISLVAAWIAWLIVGSILRKQPATEAAAPVAETDSENRALSDRRLFLHLLAAMQRDGRLMDFLAEDLDAYEDAQIGSAVRTIHAGCKQALQKYLNPQPVMNQEEGETVTLPADFDPGLITVTGKVTGNPPFTGTLRHKGWQAENIKLPTLSGHQNVRVIAPAEVEIP